MSRHRWSRATPAMNDACHFDLQAGWIRKEIEFEALTDN